MIRLTSPTADRVVYRLAALLLTRGPIARRAWHVLTWPIFVIDEFIRTYRERPARPGRAA